MISELERLDKHRSQVGTRSGPASYVDTGGPGRPVLFVHGVGTSSYLWRHVIAALDGQRRCVANGERARATVNRKPLARDLDAARRQCRSAQP